MRHTVVRSHSRRELWTIPPDIARRAARGALLFAGLQLSAIRIDVTSNPFPATTTGFPQVRPVVSLSLQSQLRDHDSTDSLIHHHRYRARTWRHTLLAHPVIITINASSAGARAVAASSAAAKTSSKSARLLQLELWLSHTHGRARVGI